MDLALKPEHKAFADEVRAFARANLSPATKAKTFSGKHYDKDDHIEWQKALGRQGWLAYTWPRKYGGPGWDVTQRFLFENVLAEEGAPRIIPFGPKMVGPVIYTFGTDEQKERFLPGIRSSEVSWCQGYSEPGAGSDLASLRTKAVREGDHYIVNGQKTWTSFAHWGDWIFCLVRTNTEAKAQEGISFLLIDMKTPGVTVHPVITMEGDHEVNETHFEDVRVPVENLVGKEGEGFKLAQKWLGIGRLKHGARALGVAERCIEMGASYSKQRVTFGKPLSERQGITFKLADSYVELHAARLMVYQAAWKNDQKQDIRNEAYMAKLFADEMSFRVVDRVLQIHGGIGLTLDLPLAKWFVDQRSRMITEGASEVMRMVIAREVLKKYN
jgi:alkylation response protein AidB-like acyl-CoA dehydrogenase